MALDPTANSGKGGIRPKGLQALTPQIIHYLQNIDPQLKLKFDFILFRNPGDEARATSGAFGQGVATAASAGLNVVGLGADLLMAKVYVEAITFKPVSVVGERVNGDIYTKDIEYPESCSITFIDDDRGLVMRYLQDWRDDIMFPKDVTDARTGYVFRDAQEGARRTGILMMANKRGSFPPTYPRITFYGLFPKGIGDITVGQKEDGNLTYQVEFYVREVRVARLV